MGYIKQNWANLIGGGTKINASRLQYLEDGLEAAAAVADTALAAAGSTTRALNTQTGTSYTLVIGDAAKLVEMSNASANTLTVPPNSSVAFATGTEIPVRQLGAGLTTIAAGAGVTIRSFGGALKFGGQYAEAILIKRGTDEWVLSGQVTP